MTPSSIGPISGESEVVRRSVSEYLIGLVHPNMQKHSLVISPDGRRVAYVARASEGKDMVVVDGEAQKEYEFVKDASLVFSPDSQRLAYIARVSAGETFIVLDREEQAFYYDIDDMIFSPDSQRVAFLAEIEVSAGSVKVLWDDEEDKYELTGFKVIAVVDGQEQSQYDNIASTTFNPDSQRLAYMARLEER